jgi:hypothetical protein
MKYLLILPLLFLIAANLYADSTYLTPSVYYTRGEYNDGRYSDSYAGFLSIGTWQQRVLFSYDQLRIADPEWQYNQKYFNAGAILGLTNFFVKPNYGHLSGHLGGLNYHNDIYSIDAFYTNYTLYLGGSYTFQSNGGYFTEDLIEGAKDINQVMLRFEYIPHWRVLLSVKPVYTYVSDGRNLFGASFRFHYLPFDKLLLKVHGFAGERAYFFDPDLLVIYNQDDTQKYLASAQLEYLLSPHFHLIGGFQHTSFGSYKINYYFGGIRTNFMIE